ncbi:preprotein translocase subunit YajC [Staphylococcus edaphicus]|uniref:Preprotein translocase subunit YajC n=1 Tax=Staphylococcus edaphicus TaxID=1955013 RepID=A0A2C6WJT9_9STAP|nr:preprotein translocase subunit YajC [Staphylococcus edaphicus]
MRLKKSLKYSVVFFLIITFLTILFRPTEIGIDDIMNAHFFKTLILLSNEFIKTLAVSLPPAIVIFFVYYFYILKPNRK